MKKVLSLLALAGLLTNCTSSVNTDNVSDAATLCENDSLTDILQGPSQEVKKQKIKVIPVEYQLSAYRYLEGQRFKKLLKDEISDFGIGPEPDSGDPYLVQACFYSIRTLQPTEPDLWYRALNASDYWGAYFPDTETLVFETDSLAGASAKPGPVFFVVWSEQPVTAVRITSGGAI